MWIPDSSILTVDQIHALLEGKGDQGILGKQLTKMHWKDNQLTGYPLTGYPSDTFLLAVFLKYLDPLSWIKVNHNFLFA